MPSFDIGPVTRALVLGAVGYVVAGFFVDLPPRGITLNSSSAMVMVNPGMAQVSGHLTYVNRSWRPRRTDVYLPFCHAHGEGDVQQFTCSDTVQTYRDGVLLSLSMAPSSRHQVDFSFSQPTGSQGFQYQFSTARGWGLPPNLVNLQVQSSQVLHLVPAASHSEPHDGQTIYTIPGDEVTVMWD